MVTGKPAFHVRQDATPTRVEGVLMALAGANTPMSYEGIYERTQSLGYDLNNRYEPIVLLKDLGALERKTSLFTKLGHDLYNLLRAKRSDFLEVMHFLHYTAWGPTAPGNNCFSWSYRTVCDRLWESGSTAIDRQQLVSQISEQAMLQFNTKQVSFGPSSIDGILHWLRVLNPTVITYSRIGGRSQAVFSRRIFCPPEIFILAVDYLYRRERVDYQANLLLDADKQETICKVCLLEPTAFETTLEWATGQYPFLQRSSSGGWGSYILLTHQPQIQDFLG